MKDKSTLAKTAAIILLAVVVLPAALLTTVNLMLLFVFGGWIPKDNVIINIAVIIPTVLAIFILKRLGFEIVRKRQSLDWAPPVTDK